MGKSNNSFTTLGITEERYDICLSSQLQQYLVKVQVIFRKIQERRRMSQLVWSGILLSIG